MPKLPFQGEILGVQPRIRLIRSFDERSHEYLGFQLLINGDINGTAAAFTVAIGPATHAKHAFRVGGFVSGDAETVLDANRELSDLHKASKIRYAPPPHITIAPGPPYILLAPDLETYRARGHRRLATVTYAASCRACKWGCRMAVDIIRDHWKPHIREHRVETFCYGPKSCPLYRAGATRKAPSRTPGMSYEEENWVDDEATSHRGPDD